MVEPKAKTSAKKFSKEALLNHFTGVDRSIAKSILTDAPQTIKQAEDAINKWKKEDLK